MVPSSSDPVDKTIPPPAPGTTASPWHTRTRLSKVLTVLTHGSAPFITTFLIVHLAAPSIANLGGSALSSQTMLIGREYYQTMFGERYLVFGPLFIHSTCAILKRLFSLRLSRPLSSALSVTGYATALFFLPIHVITHRLAPADPTPPISSLSPSELDYEYVKAALRGWPVRSTLLYTALVFGVTLHAADGIAVMWSTWAPESKLIPGRRVRQILTGATVVLVLNGLAVVAREPLLAFASTAGRFRAALRHSIVYRL